MGNFLNSINKYLLTFIIGVVVTLLFLKRCDGNHTSGSEEIYKYKTDTIFTKKGFTVSNPFSKTVKPRTVIIYKDSISLRYIEIIQHDSIFIVKDNKNHDSTIVSEDFLKKFPKSRKLLSLDLSKDTLNFTTMGIDAQVTTHVYPIYLDKYQYRYLDGSLTMDKVKGKNTNKVNWGEVYINGGYSVLIKQPLATFEYQNQLNRLKLSLEASSTIQNQPQFNAVIKLGYRISKK